MSRCKWTKEQLAEAIKNNLSIAGVCRELGIRPIGGNYKTLHYYIKEYNLDTSHFTGQGWNAGTRYRNIHPKCPIEDILSGKVEYRNTLNLKNRLLKENIKEHKCENCGNSEWLGNKIPLELHHINGNNTDNRLENLQLLCPNCHALTDNYRGNNTRSALSEKREVECRKFKEALAGNADGNLEPSLLQEGAETRHDKSKSKSKKKKEPKFCEYCGKELINNKYKYCSRECYHKANSGKRPPVYELLDKFKKLKSYLQVGKYYGVSDSAVKKWVVLYQIEDMIKEQSRPQT